MSAHTNTHTADPIGVLMHRPIMTCGETPPLIRMTARLAGDAEWRVTAGAQPIGILRLLLDQPGGMAVRVVQIVGSNPLAMQAASRKCGLLRRGTRVTVEAERIVPHCDFAELMGVREIVLHALPTPPACGGDA